MSSDEVYLTFCEFKDEPPPGFSKSGEGQTHGYYWWQSDVDAAEGTQWNVWKSLETRDKDIKDAGGILPWISQVEPFLEEAIHDAIQDNGERSAEDHPERAPSCTLHINGSSITVIEDEDGYLVEQKTKRKHTP